MSRPKAEILTVGAELLTGSTVNTNAAFLGRELTDLGFEVQGQTACPDDIPSIQAALGRALKLADLIVVSGGLGPTPDDVTRDALAEFFNVPLVFSKVQYREIERQYRRRGRTVPKIVKREAHFPANAKPVFNRFGVALGFIIQERGSVVIAVPGVPGELIRLYQMHLKPFLCRHFIGLGRPARLIVKTIGLSEPTIMKRLSKNFFKMGEFKFGIYPQAGEVAIRIQADRLGLVRRLKKYMSRALNGHIYSFDEVEIEEVIGKRLTRKSWTLSVAESCTGGQVSRRITRVAGASRYFSGGVVAYQNRIKTDLLQVPQFTLLSKGAVSKQTAAAMAKGVRQRFASRLGISVTGIAGPAGGTRQKPVGLVYFGMSDPVRCRSWQEFFTGDREQIQERATKKALEYLWRWIQG